MGSKPQPGRGLSLVVRPDRPLIGVVLVEDGQEVTRYFVDEVEADAAQSERTVADARALAGAWSDLDWEEMVEELDRIRHVNTPTPPIDEPRGATSSTRRPCRPTSKVDQRRSP